MRNSKLGLDFNKVDAAKGLAREIALDVQNFVENYSTVAVERTLCRLIGIDGVDANDVPLPNVVVNEIHEAGLLGQGVLYFMGNAILETKLSPQEIAEKVSVGELNLTKIASHPIDQVKEAVQPFKIGRAHV